MKISSNPLKFIGSIHIDDIRDDEARHISSVMRRRDLKLLRRRVPLSNVKGILEHLELDKYADIFEREELKTLEGLNETDLIRMGIPTGPMKEILKFISKQTVSDLSDEHIIGDVGPSSVSERQIDGDHTRADSNVVQHQGSYSEMGIGLFLRVDRTNRVGGDLICFDDVGDRRDWRLQRTLQWRHPLVLYGDDLGEQCGDDVIAVHCAGDIRPVDPFTCTFGAIPSSERTREMAGGHVVAVRD